MLNKYWIKKEISIIHLIMLITSKLMVAISIGSMVAGFTLPYSYLILLFGVFILVPALITLFKKEEKLEERLEHELELILKKEQKDIKKKKKIKKKR